MPTDATISIPRSLRTIEDLVAAIHADCLNPEPHTHRDVLGRCDAVMEEIAALRTIAGRGCPTEGCEFDAPHPDHPCGVRTQSPEDAMWEQVRRRVAEIGPCPNADHRVEVSASHIAVVCPTCGSGVEVLAAGV